MTTLDPSPCSPQYWNDAILSYCLKKNKAKELDSSSWLSQKASVYKDVQLLKEPRLHFTLKNKLIIRLLVYFFPVLTQKIDIQVCTIFGTIYSLLIQPLELYILLVSSETFWKLFWIIDLYKFGLYGWNFSCKIEPCPLPVENGPAKCGLQCEAVEDPHLAPHHHTTCGLFASFDLEFTGRKGKLVWRLKRNTELLYLKYLKVKCHHAIPLHLKYDMQKLVTKVIDHYCYKTCSGWSITNCEWFYILYIMKNIHCLFQ